MKILPLDQGSDVWKEERRKWATASDMASILGIPGAFSTREKLIQEKRGGGEKELNEYMRNMFAKGHEAEKLLKAEAEIDFGVTLSPLVGLDKRRGIMVSLDAVCMANKVLVECKNSWSVSKLQLAKDGTVWEPYRVQILTQMLVTKIPEAWLYMKDDTTGEVHKVKVQEDKKMMRRIAKEAKLFVKELNDVL